MIHATVKTCLWVLVVMLLAAHASAQGNPWTPDLGLQDGPAILEKHPEAYRALPSVYIINSVGDGTLYCPTRVECDDQALDELYAAAVAAHEVPAGFTSAVFKWVQIAAEPDKYLRVSDEMQPIELHDTRLGHGTAYAVSREGVLLTNRHVIDHEVISPFCQEVEPVGFTSLVVHRLEAFGAWDGDPELESLVCEFLTKWYASKCDSSKVYVRLMIAAAYQDEAIGANPDAGAIALQMTLKQFGQDTRQPVFTPVAVIAQGKKNADNELVNDIAVLRIQGNVNDALVCLPLADEGEVQAAAPIFSLGFPGYKYDLTSGQLTGLYKVNVESGSIAALPNESLASSVLRPGVVTLNAKLRGGCSGGPVILKNGRVVAMNVAHKLRDPAEDAQYLFPVETTGEAVTLSEIKKLLNAQGITLDVGPTTRLWNEAFDDYLRDDLTAAAAKLRQVAAAQQFRNTVAFGQPQPIVNQYVSELLSLCAKHE